MNIHVILYNTYLTHKVYIFNQCHLRQSLREDAKRLIKLFAFTPVVYLKGHRFNAFIKKQKAEILTCVHWDTQYNSKRNQGGVCNSNPKI